MKKILGLDIGTNSVGWALIENDFDKKEGTIKALGSRIIPLPQDILDKFGQGQSLSQTAERTKFRGIRRLYQRDNLRRERLHRVLNILGFLPEHYAGAIDFEKHFGQFKKNTEVKLNYRKTEDGKYEFIFKASFLEMVEEFKKANPELFRIKQNGKETQIPYDWTIYYLRKKALTTKITKEELAWLLLNFNQKRGYYQLRSENENTENNKDDKKKEFVVLKVNKIIDSGEIIKNSGDKLYDVYFDNGWKYDKQITKIENWNEKTKEFIVTTSTTKNGEIKRTFKAVDSEKDWPAIKAKTEQDIKTSGKTVGTYIYESLLNNPMQKIRGGLIRTIERKYYRNELEKILEEQTKHHNELKDNNLYNTCIEELYPNNKIQRNILSEKDFKYLFIDDIIFYQRPLKSKKSTIANCAYESKVYVKDGEKIVQPLKGISKSHPLFQEFRLWQFLKNLRIYNDYEQDVTSDIFKTKNDWVDLFDYLSTLKEVEQKNIISFLIKKSLIDKNVKNYRWNYVEDKKYPTAPTRASFINRLKRVKGVEKPIEFLIGKTELGKGNKIQKFTREVQLWHIIYSVKDKYQFDKALKTFARKHSIDVDSFFTAFEKYPPFKSAYGSYSEKALKKILPLMRMGKYWNENAIPKEVKDRISRIKQRLESINYNEEVFKTDKDNKLKTIVDDLIPKQLLKSFVQFKNKNHLEGLNTYQACYAVYERHSESSDIIKWNTPKDIDEYLENFKQHSLRNPIVEQIVTETLRTVRDIWQFYGNGETDFFDEIHIELGRDMKNPAEKRKKISERNNENERANQRVKALLTELMNEGAKPYSPSHQEILKIYEEGVFQNPDVFFENVSEDEIIAIRKKNAPTKADIQKYKLWLQQGYRSPYTGKIIPLSKLFTTEYEIEHIIPQARFFDDSLSNKVICETEVNRLKKDKTAYEFIKNPPSQIVNLGHQQSVKLFNLEEYESHCKRYFSKNRIKLKKLLSEEIPENFIERQLNDTRYISKFIKSLLSNIVREEGEKEVTSKNLLPVTGVITSKLKKDWGLNEVWNEIITPRFKRMNELTNSENFGYWDYQKDENGNNLGKQFFRIQIPDDISKGFSKKRIDHRHHSLDALVVACTTRNHIQYLNSLNNEKIKFALQAGLLIKNDKGHFTKQFKKPWKNFTVDTKNSLGKIIISFKKNTRVLTKATNYYWKWEFEDGRLKKKLKEQKTSNRAIRKPLHKETFNGKLKWETSKDKVITASRVPISEVKSFKHLKKITDSGIRKILFNHLRNFLDDNGNENFELAFSADGIERLNKNIFQLNDNKFHQPIYKVRFWEEGKKFIVGERGNKKKKYVEAAKGTNLFFVIYWNEEQQKREYETIPLNEVIEHQRWRATLPKDKINDEPMIPINSSKGRFLFSLSPNDLVYIPKEEEIEYTHNPDFNNLTKEQIERIYTVNDFSSTTIYFTPHSFAKAITKKEIDLSIDKKSNKPKGSYDSKTASYKGKQIKEICWKLEVDRLGNIINDYK